jgi:hypothetical protein
VQFITRSKLQIFVPPADDLVHRSREGGRDLPLLDAAAAKLALT